MGAPVRIGPVGDAIWSHSMRLLSRIAQLDQRTALPDQCQHSAEAERGRQL